MAIKINTLIIDESVAAQKSHRIIKRIILMNPLKCGSCDGPQVQHKNNPPTAKTNRKSAEQTVTASWVRLISSSPELTLRRREKEKNRHHQQRDRLELLFPANISSYYSFSFLQAPKQSFASFSPSCFSSTRLIRRTDIPLRLQFCYECYSVPGYLLSAAVSNYNISSQYKIYILWHSFTEGKSP